MEELILMIFKTHTGEWLTAVQIGAIVNAITGKKTLPVRIKKTIDMLTSKKKLTFAQGAEDRWKVIEF